MTEIIFDNIKFRCYQDGKIERYYEKKFRHFNQGWNEIKPYKETNGYLRYAYNNTKKISCHRLLAVVFLGLNYDDKNIFIDHINHITDDNRLENLRLVSNQQNQRNQKETKGYYKHKNKFRSYICVDNKNKYLGCFDTEEEAHQAYLDSKEIYHKI